MKLKTKFQDEDFELGEVVETNVYYGGSGRIKVIAEAAKGGDHTFYFETLKGMNEMFEDAEEEPKEYWFIDEFGLVQKEIDYYYEDNKEAVHDKKIAVGNYFETKEEAEKAVEKLKAWKRLRDKGFRFYDYRFLCNDGEPHYIEIKASIDDISDSASKYARDLRLLFGGKE